MTSHLHEASVAASGLDYGIPRAGARQSFDARTGPTGLPFISTVPTAGRDRQHAAAVVLLSVLAFLVTAPFAALPLPQLQAFLPIYQTAVVIGDLITVVLLLGQYDILRSRTLLTIACGYVFNALMASLHALSFPGLFGPFGLVGAGPQTTAWLYFFWHGLFPLFVIVGVAQKNHVTSVAERRLPLAAVATGVLLIAVIVAAACLWLTTRGQSLLPALMEGDRDGANKIYAALAVWALSLAALYALWRRRPHSLLDTWLMVIMCVWMLDVALAAVLNHARFDVGWYMGRVFGLLAASIVLIALLLENGELYSQLACASAMERAYLSHLPDPVVTSDALGRIWNANQAMERVFGYRVDELLGRNVSMLVADPLRGEHAGHMRRYLRSREARLVGKPREVEGRHRNGEAVALEISLSEFKHGGETFFIAAFRDLRERNRLIAALERARAEAEQADRAKSAFLATMSHEIRTPMNGVLGLVEVLAHSPLDTHQSDLVQTVRDSAGTLLSLIDDILDFSKIEAGRLQLDLQPVSIADLVEGLASSLVPLASTKGVGIDLFVAPEVPESVLADDVRLRQVIYNLMGNAIKFSAGRAGRHGRVCLRVVVDVEAPLQLCFQVLDNGIGMSADTVDNLFQPFMQAEVSTTRMYGGTGLGLAISHRLVTLMGGRIAVDSVPGAGSTFSVSLPFEPDPDRMARARPQVDGVCCVLLRDDRFRWDDLRAYLVEAGARVLEKEALVAASRDQPTPSDTVYLAGVERNAPNGLPADLRDAAARCVFLVRGVRTAAIAGTSIGGWAHVLDGDAIRRDALLRAVAAAAGLAPAPATAASTAPPTTRSQDTDAAPRLLVADDDPTNRKVILNQLQLLGHTVDVVENGAEALRLWQSGRYALVMTDLHMPGMDGYALAAQIRLIEAGGPRTPIVALTANALRGESVGAFRAGMDEYLTKPVTLDRLRVTLSKWLSPPLRPVEAVKPRRSAAPAKAMAAIDMAALQAVVGEDERIQREFLSHFASIATAGNAELDDACREREVGRIVDMAHRLKSSARSVGALELGDAWAGLEAAAAAGDTDSIELARRHVAKATQDALIHLGVLLGSEQPLFQ